MHFLGPPNPLCGSAEVHEADIPGSHQYRKPLLRPAMRAFARVRMQEG